MLRAFSLYLNPKYRTGIENAQSTGVFLETKNTWIVLYFQKDLVSHRHFQCKTILPQVFVNDKHCNLILLFSLLPLISGNELNSYFNQNILFDIFSVVFPLERKYSSEISIITTFNHILTGLWNFMKFEYCSAKQLIKLANVSKMMNISME